jgi:hypothetical protein
MSTHAGVITVTSSADSGPGTLRQAIAAATPGDVIDFDSGLAGQTITLTSGQLKITKNLSIVGLGADQLVVSGNNMFRVFSVDGAAVLISGLTVTRGNGSGDFDEGGEGGGILLRNQSALTLQDCAVSTNTAPSGNGGGVFALDSDLTLLNCSVVKNQAAGDAGGIAAVDIGSPGKLAALTNCTVSGNLAVNGGGIFSYTATVFAHCTISSNTASANVGGISIPGGGVTSRLRNSLVAGNTQGGVPTPSDLSGSFFSEGYNLIGTGGIAPGPGDLLGTPGSPIDPVLGPLQNNGGPSPTHALLAGSPAINAGDPAFTPPPATDQRGPGFPRVRGAALDIGAFEFTPPNTAPAINCPDPAMAECAPPAGVSLTLTATVTDNDGDALTVTWTVDGMVVQTDNVPAGGPPTLANVSLTRLFGPGPHTVDVAVSDGVAAPVTCSTSVTVVQDVTPPTIACPSNIFQPNDPGLCSAVVTFVATAMDVCSGPLTPTCTPPSGTAFPKGPTTVTCTVSDFAGNPASCSFTVTVNDTEAPSIACPANVTTPATGPGGAAVGYPAPSASDNCALNSVSCAPSSGSTFPIGTTTVTCTATDTSANSSICTFTITVTAQTPRGTKIQVRDELVALLATVTDGTDRKKLQNVIGHLNKSLDPTRWIDDSHPKPGSKGEGVFNEEKATMSDLKSLRTSNKSGIPAATVQGYIDRLVGADRNLAVIAINEAIARSGNPSKIASAQSELSKGDTDAANDKPNYAIDHYKNAWKYAISA